MDRVALLQLLPPASSLGTYRHNTPGVVRLPRRMYKRRRWTICLYLFMILEQSVPGSYFTSRAQDAHNYYYGIQHILISLPPPPPIHHHRAEHYCARGRVRMRTPPHRSPVPLSLRMGLPSAVLWIIINQRIMGYLLTANVRRGAGREELIPSRWLTIMPLCFACPTH